MLTATITQYLFWNPRSYKRLSTKLPAKYSQILSNFGTWHFVKETGRKVKIMKIGARSIRHPNAIYKGNSFGVYRAEIGLAPHR